MFSVNFFKSQGITKEVCVQAFQDHDWSFDNLDEIVAIAIKAEFNTFDLADLTNDVVTVKEELAGMPMAQPEVTNSTSEAVTPGMVLKETVFFTETLIQNPQGTNDCVAF